MTDLMSTVWGHFLRVGSTRSARYAEDHHPPAARRSAGAASPGAVQVRHVSRIFGDQLAQAAPRANASNRSRFLERRGRPFQTSRITLRREPR